MQPRIILLEDEELIRVSLSLALSRKGYEVVCAEGPTFCHAFQKIEQFCCADRICGDFLLTDNKMPFMSGLEFIERQMSVGCKGAIANKAVMSAYWNEEDLNKAEELGCKTFDKPLNLQELYDWLEFKSQQLSPDRKLVSL